jgi:hypothetical protein
MANLENREIFSAAELSRREQTKLLFAFANDNVRPLSSECFAPGSPHDWADPRGSLFAHPAVEHCVRVAASSASLAAHFRADKYEYLEPETYLAELAEEIRTTGDTRTREFLTVKAYYFERLRITDAEMFRHAQEHAKTHADNLACALRTALNFCKGLVRDWMEIIPAENFQVLHAEMERLGAAPVVEQMKWFGLADLLTTDN